MRTTCLQVAPRESLDIIQSLRHIDGKCVIEVKPGPTSRLRLIVTFSCDVSPDDLHKRNLVPSDTLRFESPTAAPKGKPRRDRAALAELEGV